MKRHCHVTAVLWPTRNSVSLVIQENSMLVDTFKANTLPLNFMNFISKAIFTDNFHAKNPT